MSLRGHSKTEKRENYVRKIFYSVYETKTSTATVEKIVVVEAPKAVKENEYDI